MTDSQPPSPPDPVDALRARVHDLEQRLNEERLARETDMVSQEHRLIPAIRNLLELLRRPRSEALRLLPAAGGAVAWCLLPSPGTATVGLVALLSLGVAWQQSRLLALQNSKIDVQNALSEAQRRANLVVEMTAIFERIDEEKKGTSAVCGEPSRAPCYWTSTVTQQQVFRPSRATLGRIAALTQALRPYRYLVVESTLGNACPEETSSQPLAQTYQRLLGSIVQRGPKGANQPIAVEVAKRMTSDAFDRVGPQAVVTMAGRGLMYATRLADALAGVEPSIDSRVNCSPASPERGQLLTTLHAAGIDISAVHLAGGNFTYSDFPAANLSGIDLQGVDLSGSRLPRATFTKSNLVNVKFRGADLNNARFDQTSIEGVDFEGARFQDYRSDGDAPMWFMPERAQRNQMSGMLFYQESKKPNIFDRLCLTLSGFGTKASSVADEAIPSSGPIARTLLDVTGYGLLVETRKRVGEDYSKQYAVLVAQLGLPDGILFERSTAEASGESGRFQA